jgi:peptidoglycan/xylan/chitin deacetylase (PgdA/CDA1 family)
MITEKQVMNPGGRREAEPERIAASKNKSAWILTYHEVEPERSNYLYAVTAEQLDGHLGLLAARKKQLQDETAVTFDDGHVSSLSVAEPLLEKHGLKATFFITAERPGVNPKTMSWAELRELARRGHTIQSHGWSHKFLVQCSPTELREELSRSKSVLEDHLGTLVDAISVPGGRWNLNVLRAAAESGYRRVYTSDFWSKRTFHGTVEVLGRFMVRTDMSLAQIERWISTDVDSLRVLRIKQAFKNSIRRMAGDQLYHKVWCWLAVSKPSAAEEENG